MTIWYSFIEIILGGEFLKLILFLDKYWLIITHSSAPQSPSFLVSVEECLYILDLLAEVLCSVQCACSSDDTSKSFEKELKLCDNKDRR